MEWDGSDPFADLDEPAPAADAAPDRLGAELVAEMATDAGLRALARETGIPRTTLRRLRDGRGCNLRNLAKLTEARPTTVVYVDGVPYRLTHASEVPLAPDLLETLDRDATGGARALEPARSVVARLGHECERCGGGIAPGETCWVRAWTSPEAGLRSERYCDYCKTPGGPKNPTAGNWADTRTGTSNYNGPTHGLKR